MRNTPILTGRLSRILDDEIQISGEGERLPMLQASSAVKVSILNSELGLKVLFGKTYLSTPDMIRIADLRNAAAFERRNFFRVRVDLKVEAFPARARGKEPDEAPESLTVRVYDVSLGGLFFVSDRTFRRGEKLTVRLRLFDEDALFPCKVLRSIPVELGTEDGYGCKFVGGTARQMNQLCRYIFEKQREQIRRMREESP